MEDFRHTLKYFFAPQNDITNMHREAEHVFLGILNELVHFSSWCCLDYFLYFVFFWLLSDTSFSKHIPY